MTRILPLTFVWTLSSPLCLLPCPSNRWPVQLIGKTVDQHNMSKLQLYAPSWHFESVAVGNREKISIFRMESVTAFKGFEKEIYTKMIWRWQRPYFPPFSSAYFLNFSIISMDLCCNHGNTLSFYYCFTRYPTIRISLFVRSLRTIFTLSSTKCFMTHQLDIKSTIVMILWGYFVRVQMLMPKSSMEWPFRWLHKNCHTLYVCVWVCKWENYSNFRHSIGLFLAPYCLHLAENWLWMHSQKLFIKSDLIWFFTQFNFNNLKWSLPKRKCYQALNFTIYLSLKITISKV